VDGHRQCPEIGVNCVRRTVVRQERPLG
jgi:hypothetical protein